MRNLKRALSLTLASVMLLGMMVVGSSAAQGYDDVADTDNVEAIEVLQAIEVMVGDERGFGPDRPVNRAEMAVVMALLLNLDYDYYVSTCPFNDVYDWARGPVGACYANGIVSGRGDGIYDPGATVTAVEAASMLMRALGYFRYQNDYEGNFVLATVKKGSQIRIFDGVGSSASEPMTRNQVAQMVLNALQTGMAEPDGNTLNLATPEGNIYTGKVNYVNVTSNKDFARAISSVRASSMGSTNDSPIVELGEQLYNGELKLKSDELDAFGRPSRTWEYQGKAIGTYMKKELLKEEYSVKVTGKDLYDLIGKATIEDKDYEFSFYIDGEETEDSKDILGSAYFTRGDLNKSNKEKVGETGNGVLTQVFVNGDDKEVTIAIINTYLAKATADYNEKKEEATLEVYAIDKKTVGKNTTYVKEMKANQTDSEKLPLAAEDFSFAKDVKDGDFFLVNVAEGEIQIVKEPETLSAVTLSAFSKGNYVVTDGTTYDYANAIEYDPEVLEEWTASKVNLKDRQYNIYLDTYGYALGVDLVEDPDNYLFITGVDSNTSNLSATNFKANAIFLDGTMKTIEVNGKKSNFDSSKWENALVNRWFTYTVNSTTNIYSVDEVNDVITKEGDDYIDNVRINGGANDDGDKMTSHTSKKLAQFATKDVDVSAGAANWTNAFVGDTTGTYDIDVKHVSLPAIGTNHKSGAGTNAFSRIYGNDDTVYLTVQVETINATNPSKWVGVISDVNNVTVGVKNANITTWDLAKAKTEADVEGKIQSNLEKAKDAAYGAYSLYKDNGYIIATVVVGDDNAATDNLVYAYTDDVELESYASSDDQWTWTRKVAFNGVETEIKEVGDKLTHLNKMEQFNWYQVKYNAKDEVIDVKLAENALGHSSLGSGDEYADNILFVEDAINEKDTVLYEESGFNGVRRGDLKATTQKAKGSAPATYEWNEIYDEDGPSLKGSTFYARTSDKTGFYVNDEVKVIFTQKNNNKRETTFLEGKGDLEDVIGDLNQKDGWFHYEVSAILKNGQATVVVIRDLYDDSYAPIESPDHHKVTADFDDYHTFYITISDACTPTNVEVAAAIREELEGNYGASNVKVKFDTSDSVIEVSWTARGGEDVTLTKASGLTMEFSRTIEVDGTAVVISDDTTVADAIKAARKLNDAGLADYVAAHPILKVTMKNGTVAKWGTDASGLAWVIDANPGSVDGVGGANDVASIETGFVAYDAASGTFVSADDAQNLVDEATVAGGAWSADQSDVESITDAWMKPQGTATVNMNAKSISIGGTVAASGTNNFTGSPWFFTAEEGTTENHFLAMVSLEAPEVPGHVGNLYAKRASDGKKYTVDNGGLSVAFLVPFDKATGEAGAVSNIAFDWYLDEECTIKLGSVDYTVDTSNVTVTYSAVAP